MFTHFILQCLNCHENTFHTSHAYIYILMDNIKYIHKTHKSLHTDVPAYSKYIKLVCRQTHILNTCTNQGEKMHCFKEIKKQKSSQNKY